MKNKNSFTGQPSSGLNLPTTTLTVEEARERLHSQFGDMLSVHKAFQMLGKRENITP